MIKDYMRTSTERNQSREKVKIKKVMTEDMSQREDRTRGGGVSIHYPYYLWLHVLT